MTEENTENGGVSFGIALMALRKGLRVARRGWNGKGMFLISIHIQGKITLSETDFCPLKPFIAIKTTAENLNVWTAAQSDILADDWVIVG